MNRIKISNFSSQKSEMTKLPSLLVVISLSTSSPPYYFRINIALSSLFEVPNCDELLFSSINRLGPLPPLTL